MNKLLLFFLLIFSMSLFAQDEEECPLPDNKKLKKLYEKSFDRKKEKSADKRFLILKETIDIDDECVPCYFELAKRSFKRAKAKGLPYNGSREFYEKVEELCPGYHSDVYYYLGIINYEEKKYVEAEKLFKQFIEFRDENDKKFARNYDQKLAASKAILPELDFQNNFFGKPVKFDPKVVQNVSTKGDEYLPMISPDNELLFFTRASEFKRLGDIQTTKKEELVLAERTLAAIDFNSGEALPPPFNVGDNYGGVSISVDNKELYVCACSMTQVGSQPYNNCDLYSTSYQYIDDPKTGKKIYKWSELKNLGPNINGENSWEAQPSISADGKTLYFATARSANRGIDIYYSEKQEDGTWGRAKSIGNVINTDKNEKAPFMHTDSKTLYFAGEVTGSRRGAGDFDIFYTKQDDNGKWSEPKNIGYPINSNRAEEGLIVSLDGSMAYFSSGKFTDGVGGKDIYAFEPPEEAKPEKVAIVKATMRDENGDPVKKAKFKLTYADSKKEEEVEIETDDGKVALVVSMEKDDKVLIQNKTEGAAFSSRVIEKKEMKNGVIKDKDIKVEKLKKGRAYKINDINFETNSFELNEKVEFILSGLIDYLKDNPKVKIEIQGHTDDVGNNSNNLELSKNRAKAVKDYITSKGIEASRLTSKGFGETKPKLPNSSEYNRSLNRRTEFMVVDF